MELDIAITHTEEIPNFVEGNKGRFEVPWRELRATDFKFKMNFMKRISMLEFRKDARRALAAVQRGEPLLLTYRGQPIARLEPVREPDTVSEDDALLRVEAFAVDGPGHPIENDEIDRVIYGS